MRHTKWRGNASLWAAQALVMLFRTVFRIREATLPERKRTRLRQLRHKLEAMDKDRHVLLARMKTEKGWEKFDALDEFMERHADPKTLESRKPHQERMRRMRQESESLQAIHHRTDGDWAAAIAGYQDYLQIHPESHSGYSYLGGALKKMGDLNGSLSAYREAVRLSEASPVASGSNRISVADVLHAQGQTDAAIVELRDIIDGADTQSETIVCLAWNQIGDYFMEAEDRKAALHAWKKAIQCDTTQIISKKAREKIARGK